MKITKRQLRRIIKEEKAKVLAEQTDTGYDMEHLYANVLLPALRKADVDMWSYGDVFKAAMRIHYEQVTDMMSKGQ